MTERVCLCVDHHGAGSGEDERERADELRREQTRQR
jgi:hypothetical protein